MLLVRVKQRRAAQQQQQNTLTQPKPNRLVKCCTVLYGLIYVHVCGVALVQ